MSETSRPPYEMLRELRLLRQRVAAYEAAEAARLRAEEALAESEQRYRIINQSIFDYAFECHVAEDGTLNIDWLAGSFTTITGYSVSDVIGTPDALLRYLHPEDLPRVSYTLRSLRPGPAVEYDFRILTKDGAVRWLRSRAWAVTAEESDRLMCIYGATQDITDQKQAEEQQQMLIALVEHSTELMGIANLDGEPLYLNPAGQQLLGFASFADAKRP